MLPADTPDHSLGNTTDVSAFLCDSINRLRRGQLDPRVSVSRENFPFCLAQRACAALRALSLRCSFVSFLAVAFPPRLPSCTAAGFFLTILIFYTTCASLRRPCRRYCVTVKTPELVAIPPGVVIAIFPVFAPVGTLAITFVSESTVTLVAGTPPNVTFVV